MSLDVYGPRILGTEAFGGGGLRGGPGEAFARTATAAALGFGDLRVPAPASVAHVAFDRVCAGFYKPNVDILAAAAAPCLGDLRVPKRANAPAAFDGGLYGGPGEAFARAAAAAAPSLGDLRVPKRANAPAASDGGLYGAPGEAFARMAMSDVRSSANFSGRAVEQPRRVPCAGRFLMSGVADIEVPNKRKRMRHLLPMAPGSSPPKLNLNAADDNNTKARKTSAASFAVPPAAKAFSEDCIYID